MTASTSIRSGSAEEADPQPGAGGIAACRAPRRSESYRSTCRVLRPDDQYRTGGVVGDLTRHRAEQQVGEAAVAARTHDQKICVLRRRQQHGRGGPLMDFTADGDTVAGHLLQCSRSDRGRPRRRIPNRAPAGSPRAEHRDGASHIAARAGCGRRGRGSGVLRSTRRAVRRGRRRRGGSGRCGRGRSRRRRCAGGSPCSTALLSGPRCRINLSLPIWVSGRGGGGGR